MLPIMLPPIVTFALLVALQDIASRVLVAVRYVAAMVTTIKEEFEMNKRVLGSSRSLLSSIGLGCMGMSDLYGPADRKESIATIHAALEQGLPCLTPEIFMEWAIMNFDSRSFGGNALR